MGTEKSKEKEDRVWCRDPLQVWSEPISFSFPCWFGRLTCLRKATLLSKHGSEVVDEEEDEETDHDTDEDSEDFEDFYDPNDF